MKRVDIRKMKTTDLPQVMLIELATFTMPWGEATFRGLLRRKDSDLWVADHKGDIAGYAVFWAVMDQGELGNVAVDEDYRGQGVGSLLIEAVLERARERGVRDIFLEVRKSNVRAQELYKTFGFSEVGRRKNYYLEPLEDALVMKKSIDES
jgi:[ribosomal protein S18]-alanine N-acetyltransferase